MHGTVGLVMGAEMRAPMLGSIFDPAFKRWLGAGFLFWALSERKSVPAVLFGWHAG
jgi:hypothetical protein